MAVKQRVPRVIGNDVGLHLLVAAGITTSFETPDVETEAFAKA